jgi:hypothetical protein
MPSEEELASGCASILPLPHPLPQPHQPNNRLGVGDLAAFDLAERFFEELGSEYISFRLGHAPEKAPSPRKMKAAE